MRTLLLHIILFVCIQPYSIGQTSPFAFRKLEEIAAYLPQDKLGAKDTIIRIPEISKHKSVAILHNDKQQIDHLGISLFSNETKLIINKPVCDFIERLMLELVVVKDKDHARRIAEKSKISLRFNGTDLFNHPQKDIGMVLDNMNEPARFTLIKVGIAYDAIWEFDTTSMLHLQFPANRELIWGYNKKESDGILYDQLMQNTQADTTYSKKPVTASDLEPHNGDILVYKGTTYAIQAINSDTYYTKNDSVFELVCDPSYPEETLSNYILEHCPNPHIKFRIQHRMYGNFSPAYEMSINRFMDFFRREFNVFTASQQGGDGRIRTTVVFQNKQFEYTHILFIDTPIDSLFDATGTIHADFYSNIPQDNIKNLYAEIFN